MPHLFNTMDLFDHCWTKTTTRNIIKCWIKSEYLSNLQVQQCEHTSHDYRNENEENLLDALIKQNETEQFYENIFVNSILPQVKLQSNGLLSELGDLQSFVDFANILNSESSGDASIDPKNIGDNLIQSLYDLHFLVIFKLQVRQHKKKLFRQLYYIMFTIAECKSIFFILNLIHQASY